MNRRIEIVMDTTGGYSPDVMPRLVLAADAMHTPVKIVCGTWDTIVYVDRISNRHRDSILPNYYYNIIDTTNHFYSVSVYGDVSFLSSRGDINLVKKYDFTSNNAMRVIMCDSNMNCDSILLGSQPALEALTFGHTNLVGIDIDSCPSLNILGCHYTNFSAQAYDELMCRLPERLPTDSAKFFVSDGGNNNADASFFASTSQNALFKNWTFYDRRSGATTVRTTGANICSVPVRKIRLKVQPDSVITLNFVADSANSPIRIVSGTTDTIFRVGTSSTSWQIFNVRANDSYMDIYGNLSTLYCNDNNSKVVGLDISQNPYLKRVDCYKTDISQIVFGGVNKLEVLYARWCNLSSINLRSCPKLQHLDIGYNGVSSLDISSNPLLETCNCQNNRLTSLDIRHNPLLYGVDISNNQISTLDVSANLALNVIRCYGNPMTAAFLDDLICALPDRTSGNSGYIMALANINDSSSAIYDANVVNAYAKRWWIYDTFYALVMSSNGTFLCPPTTTPKIRMKVLPNNDISINFAADTSNTPIRVLCGSLDTVFIADTVFTMRSIRVHADAVTMDIYGDVKSFYCSGNQNKVWSLDVSQNPYLKKLNCSYNAISPSIPFAENIMIEELDMSHNNITAQSLRRCPNLTYFNCSYNNISSINILSAPVLETFYCDNNSIAALDISNNPLLSFFDCSNNRLSSLDFSANTAIEHVRCCGNSLSARALDEMMCSLPTVNSGILVPMGDVTDSNDAFYDANVRNAIAKHWSVFDSNNYQVHS
ncbi:MAG: leucine-rich repeat domain-containing protein, partial [Bacteroidales bacterium]|nr:leucine-rich repeat domain-containing protein [Bacteroidales bacterium]